MGVGQTVKHLVLNVESSKFGRFPRNKQKWTLFSRWVELNPDPKPDYYQMKADLKELADNLGGITFSSIMGTDDGRVSSASYPVGPDGKKLKPCCACPETKKARDACIIENGEENCTELIEAHKACMRNLGFNI